MKPHIKFKRYNGVYGVGWVANCNGWCWFGDTMASAALLAYRAYKSCNK